ncbi:uncharacterized protein LOC123524836 [Mercenaria mercenaria]|uniref:uncharacterized protein LOC123524836 n=1 Tax=Mercenaria mercenaria TaxID=6596 RepID=UPI00234E4C29|nr:uncharacterized protein LOC123524836 [Mercenaria mercenaria]
MASLKISILVFLLLLYGICADNSFYVSSKTSFGKEDAIFAEKVVPNKSTKSRNKRADCLGNWIFNSECSCSHSLCSEQSIRDAVTTVCTTQTCYLSSQQSAVWTTIKPDESLLSVQCQPEQCYDTDVGYTCTCQKRYEDSDLHVYLPATIVPVVGVSLAILCACIYYRQYRKKQQFDIAKQCITIKCNVLFIVDAKDELKRYTEQLMVALRVTVKI